MCAIIVTIASFISIIFNRLKALPLLVSGVLPQAFSLWMVGCIARVGETGQFLIRRAHARRGLGILTKLWCNHNGRRKLL
jgi:hypothetical protein